MHTLFVGDLSLDLSLVIPRIPAPDEKLHCSDGLEGLGGVVANAAVAFARAGGAAHLVVQAGTDAPSDRARLRLKAEPLTLDMHAVPGALGRVVSLLEPHGDKRLILHPGVSLFPGADQIARIRMDDAHHVHTACFGPEWLALIERAKAAGIGWSLDLEPASFAGGIETLTPALSGAELVFCNDHAADLIGPDPVDRLFALGVKAVVRSHGAGGAAYHEPDRTPYAVPAPAAGRIVDTTGAGDCLAGWFLAGRVEGISAQMALRRAVTAASLSCTRLGVQSSFPTRTEILSSLPTGIR